MPTINATSVPYSGAPTVEPQGAPTRFQSIDARPEAFGAAQGRALSQLGGAFEQASDKFAHIQDLYDKVAAENASNNWNDQANKILYGDPNTPGDVGFYGKRGEDALREYPKVRDALNKLREQHRGSLTNVMQQMQFDNETRRNQTYLMAQVGRHYSSQFDEFQIHTAKAADKLGEQSSARAANNLDWEGFQLGLTQRLKAVDREIAAIGGNEEMRQARYGEIRSEEVKKWTAGLATKNPVAAMQFAEANRDAFDKSTYEQTVASLKERASKMQALIDTNQIPAPSGWKGERLSGDLWTRVKGAEGGVGPQGEALVSPKGAIGVSQIIPSTAKEMAADLNLPYDERRLHTDQSYNARLGKGYLDKMLARFNGNEALAAAAYNAGPDRVESWLRTIGDPRKGEISDADFARQIPIAETRNYVAKIISGTARAPLEPKKDFDLAIGDSIAVQQIRHGVGGMEGTTATVGHSPQQVLNTINTAPQDQIQGKTIFLSTGASNNPAQVSLTGAQISALKAKGAASIVIPAVGPGVKNADQVNAQLKNIAEAEGAMFIQPDIKWQKDGVHPAEVDKLRAQATQGKVTAIPAPEEGQLPDSAIPGLSQRIKDLQAKLPKDDPERLMNAVKAERAKANNEYADLQHSLRIKQEMQKQASDQATSAYQKRMTTDSPNYPTTDEILKDPNLTPEAQRTLVGFIERQTKPDPASAISARNTRQLFERIHAPDDNPEKIFSKQVISDEYTKGNLTWVDREKLDKDFDEANNQTEKHIQQQKAELLKRAKVKIIPITAFGKAGSEHMFPDQEEAFTRYTRFVDNKIREFKKDNKNPDDLFNPDSPAYLGKKEILNDPQYAPKPGAKVIVDPSKKTSLETAKTLSDLQDLAISGAITEEQYIEEGIKRGLIIRKQPQAPLQ